MANRVFSASKYGQQLFNQAGARRLTVSTMGESHGQSTHLGTAIQYACWRHYNADIYYDNRTYANGGNDLAIGGTTTTGLNGLTTQLTWFQARPTDIAFIASGYNDAALTEANATTVANTVISVANSVFAAGAKFVVVMGIIPLATSGAQVGWVVYNQLIRNYAAKNNGFFFIDATSILGEHQNVTGIAYRNIGTNAAGTYQSYTSDGTHISGFAQRILAPYIADVLRRITTTRFPRSVFNSGNFAPASPHTNLLGDAGNCMGTSGLKSGSFDTGVAGTGTSSRLSVDPQGSVVCTNSIITGAWGERKQRITVSGTGGSFFTLSCTPTITAVNNGVSTRVLNFEAQIDLTSIVGLCDIVLRPLASANDSPTFNISGNQAAGAWTDGTTESLFAYHLANQAVPSGNNPNFTMLFQFTTGVTLSGTIDVSRLNAFVVDE